MNQTLTVVLPIHNAESSLADNVNRVLEVASELTADFEVLIVDDGSQDDSFEVASELATRFPQVRVMRQAHRRGLGPTMKRIRKTVKSDVVMVHDGVSSANAEQLRLLWNRRSDAPQRYAGQPSDVSMADLLRPSQNQVAMAAAHRRVLSYQLLTPSTIETNASDDVADSTATQADRAANNVPAPKGVGGIPPLPRTKLFDAMGDFALGE